MSNNNTSIHDFDFSFICNYFKLLKRQGPGSPEATRKAVSFINELTDGAKIAPDQWTISRFRTRNST